MNYELALMTDYSGGRRSPKDRHPLSAPAFDRDFSHQKVLGDVTVIASMIDFIAEADSAGRKIKPEMVINHDSQD